MFNGGYHVVGCNCTCNSYYSFSIFLGYIHYNSTSWTFCFSLAIYQGCRSSRYIHLSLCNKAWYNPYWCCVYRVGTCTFCIHKYLLKQHWMVMVWHGIYKWWLQTSAKCVNLFSIACWWILLYCLVENSSLLTAWLMFSNKLFKPFCYFSRQLFNVTYTF